MTETETNTQLSEVSVEFLRSIYFDATQTIRHYDSLRASFTQFFASLLAIASGAVTAAAVQGIVTILLPIVSGLFAVLSLLSLLIVIKINSLIKLQRKRAHLAMKNFQNETGDYDFGSISREAKQQLSDSFVSRFSLGKLWAGIFAVNLIMNLGVLVVMMSR